MNATDRLASRTRSAYFRFTEWMRIALFILGARIQRRRATILLKYYRVEEWLRQHPIADLIIAELGLFAPSLAVITAGYFLRQDIAMALTEPTVKVADQGAVFIIAVLSLFLTAIVAMSFEFDFRHTRRPLVKAPMFVKYGALAALGPAFLILTLVGIARHWG